MAVNDAGAPTSAQVIAQELARLGVERIFGFPGGEILDLVKACGQEGIEFVLTRDEATAAFMADATGQLRGIPGVCVSTLGPGAMNLALGVANAYLDRSPVVAITAATAASANRYATHQNLDLNAIYRPFTKASLMLDGENTAGTVRRLFALAVEQRPGPVHLALPSDVARSPDRDTENDAAVLSTRESNQPPSGESVERIASEIRAAHRPVVLLGFDLDPQRDLAAARRLVEQLGAPVFVTPKAKGMLPEDHALFFGVCAGVAADNLVVDFFKRSDLLIGIGFDPVESNKLWHETCRLFSLSPASIAVDQYRPVAECVGNVNETIPMLLERDLGSASWPSNELAGFRERFDRALRPAAEPTVGLSPYRLTQRLRQLFSRDTIHVTDVGSVKFVSTQCWQTYEPRTFLLSNGLSSMSYSLPGAMAAKMIYPDRPVLCSIGDGGFGMTLAEVETCVRYGINIVIVVFNDSSLSLIRVGQAHRGHPNCGVDFGAVDFAAAARALGAWGTRVETMEALDAAVQEAQQLHGPAVLDVAIDPAEYSVHAAPDLK